MTLHHRKHAFRLVHCSDRQRTWRKNTGCCYLKTPGETIRPPFPSLLAMTNNGREIMTVNEKSYNCMWAPLPGHAGADRGRGGDGGPRRCSGGPGGPVARLVCGWGDTPAEALGRWGVPRGMAVCWGLGLKTDPENRLRGRGASRQRLPGGPPSVGGGTDVRVAAALSAASL
jgi:hypothetical protein